MFVDRMARGRSKRPVRAFTQRSSLRSSVNHPGSVRDLRLMDTPDVPVTEQHWVQILMLAVCLNPPPPSVTAHVTFDPTFTH